MKHLHSTIGDEGTDDKRRDEISINIYKVKLYLFSGMTSGYREDKFSERADLLMKQLTTDRYLPAGECSYKIYQEKNDGEVELRP